MQIFFFVCVCVIRIISFSSYSGWEKACSKSQYMQIVQYTSNARTVPVSVALESNSKFHESRISYAVEKSTKNLST